MDHPNALQLTGSEAQNIAKCFKSKNFTLFMSHMTIEGCLCIFIKELDGKFVCARRTGDGYTLQAT